MLLIEFGSERRGDADSTSDRDLLIIGSEWQHISNEIEKKSFEGYSVSAFLLEKADYLVNNGSLFFKHICDEGALISGSTDQFDSLFSQWRPAYDYNDELVENLDLLEVINFIPKSNSGVIVVLDILITSIRNILIRRLANKGEFVFSWDQIFSYALHMNMINQGDISIFRTARRIKNLYRQGYSPRITITYMESLFKAATRACNICLRPHFAKRSELRALPEKYVDGTYKQLRAIELLCAEYSSDKTLDPLRSLVREPAYFSAMSLRRSFSLLTAPH